MSDLKEKSLLREAEGHRMTRGRETALASQVVGSLEEVDSLPRDRDVVVTILAMMKILRDLQARTGGRPNHQVVEEMMTTLLAISVLRVSCSEGVTMNRPR